MSDIHALCGSRAASCDADCQTDTADVLRQAADEIARLRAGADIIRELVACFKPFCPADYKDGTQAIRVAEAFLSAKAL